MILNVSSWQHPFSTDGSVFYIFLMGIIILGLLVYIVYLLKKGD